MTGAIVLSSLEYDLKWLNWAKFGSAIMGIRRRVFIEEQGIPDVNTISEFDVDGLHLGLFLGDQLVSVCSAYMYLDRPDILKRYGIPRHLRRVVQYTKRVHDRRYRHDGSATIVLGHLMASVYEQLRPDAIFAYMCDAHTSLTEHYARRFGIYPQGDLPSGGFIIGAMGPDLTKSYLLQRNTRQHSPSNKVTRLPCLLSFLENEGRDHLVFREPLLAENLYTDPLVLSKELPRLSVQSRILFAEQWRRLDALDLPARSGRLLDVGCGPGEYLGHLASHPRFEGWEMSGLDLSPEMIALAKHSNPSWRWLSASIYDTEEPSASYDLVHASLVMLHLINVPLALRELHRILRPGGLLYVVCGNDALFEGPESLQDLIRAHAAIYEGDRMIMTRLPEIAEDAGFELVSRASSRLTNTSTGGTMQIVEDEVRLDPMTLWGIFTFIAQREEMAAKYDRAQAIYIKEWPRIAFETETHVYTRCG